MKLRPRYSEIAVTQSFVFIKDDRDQATSAFAPVAEAGAIVVELCLANHGEKRIVCRDVDDTWFELQHTGVQFRRCAPFDGEVPAEVARSVRTPRNVGTTTP